MTHDLEKLYADLPEPRHVWVTSRQSVSPSAAPAADAAWDAFVAGHPAGHVLQTSRWAELKSAFGWQAQRVVLRSIPSPDAPILGGASILFRRLPWGQTLAYIPKGPVIDWTAPDQVHAVLTMAQALCRKRRAALLKLEPELPADSASGRLQGLGFKRQHAQPRPTA